MQYTAETILCLERFIIITKTCAYIRMEKTFFIQKFSSLFKVEILALWTFFFFFLITKSLQGIWFLLSRSKGADLLALLCWSVGGNKIHSKKKKVNQKRIASRKSIDIPFEFEKKKTGFFLLLLFLADWNDFSYSTFDYIRRRRRCNYNFIINIPMGRREKGYNNKIKKELRRE